MKKLEFDNSYIHFLPFDHELDSRNLALQMAEITINWGRLEYWLYLILHSLDPHRAEDWTKKFFSTVSRKSREKTVRKELMAAIDVDLAFAKDFENALKELELVCWHRNALAHGLWKFVKPGSYEIRPLHFDKSVGGFGKTVEFTHREASQLLNSMHRVLNHLATLATEVMARRYLKSNEERIKKAEQQGRKSK